MADLTKAAPVGGLGRLVDRNELQTTAAQQAVDSQIDRMGRICNGLNELSRRLHFVNIKVRGAIPEATTAGEQVPKDPELSLVNLTRVAEILLECCHVEANELASQIGG